MRPLPLPLTLPLARSLSLPVPLALSRTLPLPLPLFRPRPLPLPLFRPLPRTLVLPRCVSRLRPSGPPIVVRASRPQDAVVSRHHRALARERQPLPSVQAFRAAFGVPASRGQRGRRAEREGLRSR